MCISHIHHIFCVVLGSKGSVECVASDLPKPC